MCAVSIGSECDLIIGNPPAIAVARAAAIKPLQRRGARRTYRGVSALPPALSVSRGRPLPLGATVLDGATRFALFSRHASAVTLLLFEDGEATQPAAELPLCQEEHRTGGTWHARVQGVSAGCERIEGLTDPLFQIIAIDELDFTTI